ncbi:substrate-binding domain-containing protein [Glutamicibacter sp.]|uniref:substrate-binding domain-containing protein n=1 Tax=Glutamicibacter sp. TaxID=1931995 RepID=UPI002B497EAA|nr:substrate-binding domain-containing protein [Glutamicibacter sp.]HJX78954.1 substrate-binding domain-containing protein [Glutamicibacter sp.]
MKRSSKVVTALTLSAGLALTACAPTAETGTSTAGGDAAKTVNVGIVYSKTGPLAAYGDAYYEGLKAGLDYATDGTNKVGDTELNITYHDDGGDPDKAVTVAKELIGKDYKILAGTASSGIALKLVEQAAQNKVLYISGPAASDAITGANKYTFRSGRQSMQDVATAGTFVDDLKDKKVTVFAQDNAFGQGNLAAVDAILGAEGAKVSSILVPEDVTEFTPFARQLVDAKPDLVFAAWAGATSGSMWQALDQQSAFDVAPIVTGLGDVATYGAFGDAGEKISFLNHYFPGAAGTEIEKSMISSIEEAGKEVDLFSPDGFVAGQMIAQAVSEGGDDVEKMVTSLEGWTFEGPKGETTVRASDHALIQNMYQVSLSKDGEKWIPELVETVPGEEVAPPEVVN